MQIKTTILLCKTAEELSMKTIIIIYYVNKSRYKQKVKLKKKLRFHEKSMIESS